MCFGDDKQIMFVNYMLQLQFFILSFVSVLVVTRELSS